MLVLPDSLRDVLPADLDAAIADFAKARAAHALSIGQAAPAAAHPLIEDIVLLHDGAYRFEPEAIVSGVSPRRAASGGSSSENFAAKLLRKISWRQAAASVAARGS